MINDSVKVDLTLQVGGVYNAQFGDRFGNKTVTIVSALYIDPLCKEDDRFQVFVGSDHMLYNHDGNGIAFPPRQGMVFIPTRLVDQVS
jgi:hypothetical protein